MKPQMQSKLSKYFKIKSILPVSDYLELTSFINSLSSSSGDIHIDKLIELMKKRIDSF